MNKDRLIAQLTLHEGLRLKPYTDSVGKFTIGVGRNLDDVGITKDEARYLLTNDIQGALGTALSLVPVFFSLSDVRQRVIVDMAFNLGRARLERFIDFLVAVNAGDWNAAADEMKDSKWYAQVGERGRRLEEMMRTGEDYVT